MTTKAIRLALCAAALGAATANAEDYTVEAGQSATLSADATYDSMTVNGNLTVDGGTILTPSLTMTGGCVTVTGTGTRLGSGHSSNDTPTTWRMYPDENGQYGAITSRNDSAKDKGPGAASFYLQKENEAVQSDTGYIDFLTLDNGIANFRQLYNESSLTGRVSVAGSGASTLYRSGARSWTAMFMSGAWAVRIEDGASLYLDFVNQGGFLNNVGTDVDISGNADVTVTGGYAGYPVSLNRGAHFNNNGSLKFARPSGSSNYTCLFSINDSDVIGPGVTNVAHTGNASADKESQVRVADGVTATMRNVEITGNYAYLTGPGTARIDASAEECSFKANIKEGDSLVVEKVGANDMVVSATTNIPSLKVLEGAVRITSDCTISNLSGAVGATLVADGCRVSITGEAALTGLSLATANGGEIAAAGGGRVQAYEPGVISGPLHVASGSLVFSKYGFSQKHWRWTFFSINNGPSALQHRGLYLFGTNGVWQAPGTTPTYVETAVEYDNPPETALAENYCRWWHHSSTRIVAVETNVSGYAQNYLLRLSCFFDYSRNGNNSAALSSPVIDPDDETTHVGIEYCLPSTALPITGYNMRTHDNTYYANGWKVEASEDGLAWETVDVRSNQTFTFSGNYPSYDNKPYTRDTPNLSEFFRFTGYRRDGLTPLAEPLALQVDDGAEIDLRAFTDGQAIGALTIDMSAGGGTIHGGALASGGTLTLVNAAGHDILAALPLIFDGTADLANAATWSVVIDGTAKKHKVAVQNGTLRLLAPGMTIVIK